MSTFTYMAIYMCKGFLFFMSVLLTLFGGGLLVKFIGLSLLILSMISIAAEWLLEPA